MWRYLGIVLTTAACGSALAGFDKPDPYPQPPQYADITHTPTPRMEAGEVQVRAIITIPSDFEWSEEPSQVDGP